MLYLVGTPIGNYEDITYRAAHILARADIILAEDTRKAHRLISGIRELFTVADNPTQKVISYFREQEMNKLPEVMGWLKEDKLVCLISDAGMPVLNDPGFLLLRMVIAEGLEYEVLPGPSSVTTALAASGIPFERFTFVGYLPKQAGKRTRELLDLKSRYGPMRGSVVVAFETALRLPETLTELNSLDPAMTVAVCRELTKTHQEIVRGRPADLANQAWRGEITLVLQFGV